MISAGNDLDAFLQQQDSIFFDNFDILHSQSQSQTSLKEGSSQDVNSCCKNQAKPSTKAAFSRESGKKRAASSFLFFRAYALPRLKKEHPDLLKHERFELMVEEWKHMKQEEKKKQEAYEKHLEKLQKLLDIEKAQDLAQTEDLLKVLDARSAQKRGLSLLQMQMNGTRIGIGGKTCVDFEFDSYSNVSPIQSSALQSFKQGDIVSIVPSGNTTAYNSSNSGVVLRVFENGLTVAFSQDMSGTPDEWRTDTLRINKLANDVQYERMRKALIQARDEMDQITASDLTRVVLGQQKPTFDNSFNAVSLAFHNGKLNHSQKDAIAFALGACEISLILGPPGTGKTTTVVELILQMLNQNKRILVCAPSNIAVDNILERMPQTKSYKMLRIGHPARMLPKVFAYSLDIQLKLSDSGQLVSDIRKEMDDILTKVPKAKSYSDRKQLYAELKDLRKELRKREPKALNDLLAQTDVVFTTLNTSGSKLLSKEKFDVLIIDEVSQSMEPDKSNFLECWVAILKAKKAIFVGDPNQLPPTVMSKEASKKGLEKTLFTTLLEMHGTSIQKLLSVQYRMHPCIMQWANQAVYDGKLEGVPSETWLLDDLPGVQKTDDTILPLVFIDTAGFGFFESVDTDETLSRWNEAEAQLCVEHVKELVKAGVKTEHIAVITPYAAQVRIIRDQLGKGDYAAVEIGTVDGFQGREKEAIIVSLVRSNEKNQVGFLADMRRLNVALTRAKRQLCIVGDSETISSDKFMEEMVDYMMTNADIRYPT